MHHLPSYVFRYPVSLAWEATTPVMGSILEYYHSSTGISIRFSFHGIYGKCLNMNFKTISGRKKKGWKVSILRTFQPKCPLLKLGVSFVVINYVCLSFIQIHAVFYFNYIIYSGLLIFCCQNVATNLSLLLSIRRFVYFFLQFH